ncbi:hypothetical protein HDR60_03690 [bacterium]|nr:hypothetical protein [bacterium]
MEQARLYNILINPQGEVCIMLKPLSPYESEISNPEIVYDGGENAVLYRNNKDAVILDYIPVEESKIIFSADKILFVEYDIKSDSILREYFANLVKVKKLMDFGEDFVSREELDSQLSQLGLISK